MKHINDFQFSGVFQSVERCFTLLNLTLPHLFFYAFRKVFQIILMTPTYSISNYRLYCHLIIFQLFKIRSCYFPPLGPLSSLLLYPNSLYSLAGLQDYKFQSQSISLISCNIFASHSILRRCSHLSLSIEYFRCSCFAHPYSIHSPSHPQSLPHGELFWSSNSS